jgi:hypothetical protein
MNRELVETVVEIHMSKVNVSKFARRLALAENLEDDLYAAYQIDGQIVSFANGLTNENFQLDDAIASDLIATIGYDYKFTQ